MIGRNFARPGDEILISEFGYIQFEMTALRLGATLVKAAESNFMTDVDALLGAVTPKTRLLYFPQSGLKPPTLVGKTFKRAPKALMNH